MKEDRKDIFIISFVSLLHDYRWVRTIRDQKKFSFIEVNDGSSLGGIQAVAESAIESYGEVQKLTTGAATELVGYYLVLFCYMHSFLNW